MYTPSTLCVGTGASISPALASATTSLKSAQYSAATAGVWLESSHNRAIHFNLSPKINQWAIQVDFVYKMMEFVFIMMDFVLFPAIMDRHRVNAMRPRPAAAITM